MVEEIGDHSPLQPALVAPDSKLAIQVRDSNAVIEYLVRESGKDVYVLACKRSGPTAEVEFTGLPADLTTGEVLFEEPRKVQGTTGSFKDWFGPYEVHVYRFTRT